MVYGRVQGVFFRDFVARRAKELGLVGYVRNMPEGSVEIQVEGAREQLENLVDCLKVGPPSAKVVKVTVLWSECSGNYSGFTIRR